MRARSSAGIRFSTASKAARPQDQLRGVPGRSTCPSVGLGTGGEATVVVVAAGWPFGAVVPGVAGWVVALGAVAATGAGIVAGAAEGAAAGAARAGSGREST